MRVSSTSFFGAPLMLKVLFKRSDCFLDLTPDRSERLFGTDIEWLIQYKYAERRTKNYGL